MRPEAPERFERRSLRYERIGREHAVALEALLLDPRVYRTLHPGPDPPTVADVLAHVQDNHGHWERHGFGQWLLRDRLTGEMVGRGGLQHTDVVAPVVKAAGDRVVEVASPAAGEIRCPTVVEVAWAIVPERWGQGLATELALASVEVAFDWLGLAELIAFTLPGNLASRRVMEKAGFAYEREIEHAGLPHVLYRRVRASTGVSGTSASAPGTPASAL